MHFLNLYIAAAIILSILSFVLDVMTPRYFGLAVMPYFIAVALSVPGRSRTAPWLVAAIAVVFCAIGLGIKSPQLKYDLFMFNRATIMLLLLAMAWLSMKLVVYREDSLALAAAALENKRRTAFLARINHQFRTPLNAILGFSDVIRGQMLGPVGVGKYLDYANDIHYSGKHMLAIIDNVLDLTAIETGERVMHNEPLALDELLQDCATALRQEATSRGIEIAIDVPDELPQFLADRKSLTQMTVNLLINAIESTASGGKIGLSVKSEGRNIVIGVTDNGSGIPQDRLDRILQPFSQLRFDPMVSQQGPGLGLALVKAIVNAHHGVLKITSKVGQGSSFAVELPLSWK